VFLCFANQFSGVCSPYEIYCDLVVTAYTFRVFSFTLVVA